MADTSPLVNLDLVNRIYRTINAQIAERVYDPQYNSQATLGDTSHRYVNAYLKALDVANNISAGTLNNLTLSSAATGFTIKGGTTTPKTLTIADTITVNKPLTVGDATGYTGGVTVQSSGSLPTTIQGPDNSSARFLVTTTVGDSTNNGSVTVKSAGKSPTTIIGPNNSTAQFNVKTIVGATSTNTGAVTIQSSGSSDTVIQGPSGKTAAFNVATTIGATSGNTGAVEIKSAGANKTAITGPDNGSVTFTTPTDTVQGTVIIKDTSTTSKTSIIGVSTGKSLKTYANATIGSTSNTGDVSIQPNGTNKLVINGPSDGGDVTLKSGICFVETDASEDPAAGSLLKIKNIPANTFLAGPDSGTAKGVPTYREINSNDLSDVITGTSPIAATNINSKITITHDKKGPTVPTSGGDTDNQTPGFGGTFKVTSATVNEYGHTTAFNEHTVTIPSNVASETANGLMSSTDKAKLDGIAKEAEVNQYAFSNVTVGSTTVEANSKTDTLTLVAGDNVELTADTTNNEITISSSYVEASALTSGIVNTGSQAFAGVKTFSDTTDSNENRTTGAVIISGGLSVGKNIYADAVHNAVWNDLADCIEVPEDTDLEFGYCYSWNEDKVEKTSRKSKNCIGIHSNTAGLFMGEKPVKTIQAAVAGFALAYTDKVYPEGTPLTWSDDGKLTKCSLFKRLTHPERVIATFYKEEKQETWHGVKVNNRHWVKVR